VLLLLLLLQATSESTAVAAALSELEGLVSQLVGVGIYDLTVKEWRKRLRGKTTVDELCEWLVGHCAAALLFVVDITLLLCFGYELQCVDVMMHAGGCGRSAGGLGHL
jgi:hypothetical protein